jgi:hypothetical protein
MVDELKQIPGSAFQAVEGSCLMVSHDSGRALHPGTAARRHACAS